jgi:hypothetical protein
LLKKPQNRISRQSAINAIIALVFGAAFSLFLYLSFFQRNIISKTYLGVTFLILIASFSIVFFFFPPFFKKARDGFGNRTIKLIIAVSLILSIFLLGNFKILPFYGLLPKTNLVLSIPPSTSAESNNTIEFLSMRTSLGYIPLSNQKMAGDWKVGGEIIKISSVSEFVFEWEGHAGDFVEFLFNPTDFKQNVVLVINGNQKEADLFRTSKEFEVSVNQELQVPFVYKIPYIISFLVSSAFLIFILIAFLSRINIRASDQRNKRPMWFLSGLPLLVTCLFTLLVFWPGIMTTDSNSQWMQALSGNYTDWHPIFHTLLIALLMRIWYSPAIVVLAQIAALAVTFMLGIRVLEKYGVSKKVLWVLSLVFAIWPPTPLMAVTLWKDIFYAIALFSFFILILEIALTKGEWLAKRGAWVGLGVIAFFTAVFRQNGVAVSVITLALLLVFYINNRKMIALAFLLFLGLWLLIKLPVTNYLEKESASSENQLNIILLPHLAAHIDQKTALKADEEQYLSSLMPLDQWEYRCCYIGNVSYAENFDRQSFLQNFDSNLSLAINLFLRDPMVDIRHQICAGEMVWKFIGNSCSQKSANGFGSIQPGNISWIHPNTFGIMEASKFSAMIDPYVLYLGNFGFFSDQLVFYLRPALYTLAAIIIIISTSIRLHNKYLPGLLLPLLSQVLTLFVINFAPGFRYQLGTCFIGIFCIGLIFIPDKTPTQEHK